MHILNPETKRSQKYYNSTKGGVDVVDELKGEYSVAKISCRWPLKIFFALMNIAGINSQIIFRDNTNQTISRRLYLKTLGKELTKHFMIQRLQNKKLSISLRQTIMKLTDGVEKPTVAPTPESSDRPKCRFCPKRKNLKTIIRCEMCDVPICKEHTVATCTSCGKNNEIESDIE
ncbi:piggyBac transposable element-derived protein 4-like [Aphis craccivora]|uniref:PiggyBac transposable element-derived protein 4-like n=1 Tax=Aphis craccivora TaxID=307492 RepID=A0A6G0YY10_APHCR|nr:piggyBac transposable element-derived protein 4-like [Aphis craccivora]